MIVDGNTYCKIASFGPILPTEYQEVEYIEGTGTQWIDTNITLKQNSSFDVRFYEVNIPNPATAQNRTHIVGFHDGSNRFRIRRIEQDTFYFLYGNSGLTWTPGGGITMKNRLIDFHYSINEFTASRDGITFTYTPGQFTFVQSNRTIKLFAEPSLEANGETRFEGRFYFFKLKEGDTLVRNFIPCYRKSDNEIGMYDTVNGVFYTNQGTGTFLKGNNVVHTIRYKIPTEERPYISGHVTDGSSTFTFTVNGNESITVPVDSDGNWKWVVDRTITSLYETFRQICNVNYVQIFLPNNPNLTTVQRMFYWFGYDGSAYQQDDVTINILKFDTSNVINFQGFGSTQSIKSINLDKFTSTEKVQNFEQAFNFMRISVLDVSHISTIGVKSSDGLKNLVWWGNVETIILGNYLDNTYASGDLIFAAGSTNIKNISAEKISLSLSLKYSNNITKQSVLNIINAAAANVTYTLHSTVYNKCASGGEWYTDIQAAIDAKAQQGYTVTLISA